MLIGSRFQIYWHQKINQTKSTVYLIFNSAQQVIFSLCLQTHIHIYFIHYKWLLNIPYHVSHYYLTNVIINKTCFILSIFRKQRSSYIHQKTLHVVEKIEIDTAILHNLSINKLQHITTRTTLISINSDN